MIRTRTGRGILIAALATAALALSACASDASPISAPVETDPAIADLVSAAQAEGSVVLYTAQALGSVQPAADAFEAKYGIPVEIVFLTSAPLLQRFSAEAEANATASDLILVTNLDGAATTDLVPKGWLEPIKDSGIPVIDDGDFPATYLNTNTATVLYLPWIIAYNTDLVKEADAPKSFEDFADPKYKGQILTTDPAASIAFIQVWDRIQSEFGIDTLEDIAANEPRFFDSAPAAAEALAAGEGEISGPTTLGSIQPVIDAGAPIAYVSPEVTSGIQIEMGLVPADKASHPNAARLFANFLLSPEGNAALVPDGSPDVWVLNPDLDSDYVAGLAPDPTSADRKDKILTALGRG